MTFKPEDIHKLARLARLALRPEEVEQLGRDLNEIIQYVERLQEVDVTGVAPMFHAVPMGLVRRSDVASQVVGREGILGSAGYEDGLVRVPKIIE